MSAKTFIDTNILVWTADGTDPAKQERASELIDQCFPDVAISTQVLMELYSVVVRKYGGDHARTTMLIENHGFPEVVAVDETLVVQALEVSNRFQISHWDGLILAAAERARCQVVYSEDLNHGQVYGTVRVVNPFLEA